MFYSLQGEGFHTGTAAVFIRFSGCNLKCSFCDTIHKNGKELSEDEIVDFVSKFPCNLVVITGGEPAMQLNESLVNKLHEIGKYVAVETNGTKKLPNNVDWVTVSPKESFVGTVGKVILNKANEIKVVFDTEKIIPDPTYGISADHYYIQPCDTGDFKKNKENIEFCINFIKQNPKWKLSIQTQKILNVQ